MNNLTVVLLWIVGSVTAALVGLHFARRFIKPIDVHGNSEFLTSSVAIVGTLVSVVLGLLVSSSVDQYRELERCVDWEAAGIADVFRLARALPEKDRFHLQGLCIEYCEKTVSDEWPALQDGRPSAAVSIVTLAMNDTVLQLHPTDFQTANVQRELLDSVKMIGHNRETRIALVRGTWTWKLLPVILLCAILVLAISYLYVDEKPSRLNMLLVSFVAVALGANIGLLLMMSRPFDNYSCGIQPDAFVVTAKVMKEYRSKL